ncbi:MAG: PSD1 and planctomycete cytochrome C domain-containing protein [Verrucomicrobiales bacterium]|nr:PSD1 and planctomycete cytochrome C domain-containing protein [Verrucomicrobiales bacterium]
MVSVGVFLSALVAGSSVGAADLSPENAEFFEKRIRPALIEHCYKCHDSTKDNLKGGLALNSPAGIRDGGDSGNMIATGDPETSLLIEAIRYKDKEFQMPPKMQLPAAVIADFEKWIAMGAPDPRPEVDAKPKALTGMSSEEGRDFWAFRPRKSVEPPAASPGESDMAIDRFLLAAIKENGLEQSPPATKASWLRRVTFDLTGLPPTPAELSAFSEDESPDARSKVVDRLLDSPEYGVRWGRHWLDVARYADSNGLDENLTFGNAWRYRDYVIDAFQNDLPFDQFIIEQIAGDLLPEATEQTHIATGFLALGARVLAEPDREKLEMDVIDEQLDTTGKAFLGLTIGCARCHDHKFDPIMQADYYSLAAVFRNSLNFAESNTGAIKHWYEHDFSTEQEKEKLKEWDEKIKKAKSAATSFKNKAVTDIRANARAGAVDYLEAATRFEAGTSLVVVSEIADGKNLHPRVLLNTRRHLEVNRDSEVFGPWWKFHEDGDLAGMRTFYDEKFGKAVLDFTALQKEDPKAKALPDAELEAFRAALFDLSGFLTVPAKPEHALTAEDLAEYYKLEEEARIVEISAPDATAAMGIADRKEIDPTLAIHIRGSHLNLGKKVPRAIPAVFPNPSEAFPEKASGRLELAQWLADPDNPLTARVIVNRIWGWHFGKGLVSSTENFGVIGDRPSHPELLDWLSNWFVDNGWSVKKLNRLITLSASYGISTKPVNDRYQNADPDNRFLSHFPMRRLEAEAIRDSILAVSGRLDREQGGKTIPLRNRQMVFNHTSKDHTTYESVRRTAFLPIVRNNVYELLPLFDFPDPTMPTGSRQSTVIAPQALLMMNSPLLRESAAAFSSRLRESEGTVSERIEKAWLLAFGRSPSEGETEMAAAFIESGNGENEQWESFCQSLFASNEFIYLN